ncbi:hypothetical protein BV502_06000 [Leucobacter sp. OAMLP11]|nr:hypothetical protein BV502_06000 [Leucobacter sp. OAMLP11]
MISGCSAAPAQTWNQSSQPGSRTRSARDRSISVRKRSSGRSRRSSAARASSMSRPSLISIARRSSSDFEGK